MTPEEVLAEQLAACRDVRRVLETKLQKAEERIAELEEALGAADAELEKYR